MTKDELIVVLNDPDKAAETVNDLHKLIEDNPYFHTAYQLYIKGLQMTSPESMEQKLNDVAICVRDRSLLYDYITDTDTFIRRIMPAQAYAPKIPQYSAKSFVPKQETVSREPKFSAPKNEVSPDVKNARNNSLIDSFLTLNPKIVPNESQYVVDLDESLKDVNDVGTETLADIYATQGNIDQAIEIYEQLILKYPEKNICFAAQIKRLKE